jgi:hypothetical protein
MSQPKGWLFYLKLFGEIQEQADGHRIDDKILSCRREEFQEYPKRCKQQHDPTDHNDFFPGGTHGFLIGIYHRVDQKSHNGYVEGD